MDIDSCADNYIVREAELKIMLAGLGYEHAFGLFSEQEPDEDERRENILKVIVSMLEEKKLQSDGDKIYISEPLKEIVGIIARSNRIALMHFPGENSEFCCYFSSQTVVCEITDYQPKIFRLSMCDAQSVAERIVNSDIYPKTYYYGEIDESKRLWEKSGVKVFTAEFFDACESYAKLEVEFPALGTAQIIISENDSVSTLNFKKETLYETLLDLINRV